MKKIQIDDVEGLHVIITVLIRIAKDASARAEALRALLVARGVIQQDEYVTRHAETLAKLEQALLASLTQQMEVAKASALLKRLQDYEGTEQ